MSEEKPIPAPQLPLSRSLITTLGIIAMLSGFFVVLAYQITLPRITQNKQEALERAIFTVLPSAITRSNYLLDESGLVELPNEDFAKANVFAGYNESGELTGLAMEASARGYQDVVKILYGYSPESQCIVGITVLESRETPGLGDKVDTNPGFLENFTCLDASLNTDSTAVKNPIHTVKHGKKTNAWEIDAISGATITSTAIGNALQSSTSEILPLFAQHKSSLKQSLPPSPQ